VEILVNINTAHNSTYNKLAAQWLNEALRFVSSSLREARLELNELPLGHVEWK
jgi:hypothetical protein